MSKVVSIINHKGGVGKTTTTASLGAVLNKQGYKVLLIDLDAQMNLTISLGVNVTPTIYEAITKRIKQLPIYTHNTGMYIVPSDIMMMTVHLEIENQVGKDKRFTELINSVRSEYDFILIDCPPALNILTINALIASDYYLVPVQSHFLAVQGLKAISQVVNMLIDYNPKLELLGILITMYDSRRILDKQMLELIEQNFEEKLFNTKIRYSIAAAEASFVGKDIFTYSPKCILATEYEEFAEEFKQRLIN